MSSTTISRLINVAHDLYLSRVLAGAATTLVVYDWLLMFDSEYATIYQSRWTIPKALFVYIRVVTPPGILLSAFQLSDLRPALSTKLYAPCQTWAIIGVLSMFSSLMAANALLTLRLVVLYRSKRRMVWFISGFFIVTYIATGIVVIVSLYVYKSTIFYSTTFHTCGSLSSSRLMPAMFYAPAAFETFIFALTVYRAWCDRRTLKGLGSTPIIFVLYRDNFFVFGVMVVVRAWNIWIYLSLPLSSSSLGTMLMWALNTILTTRVYMNLVWLVKQPSLTAVSGTGFGDTTIGLHALEERPARLSTFGRIYSEEEGTATHQTDTRGGVIESRLGRYEQDGNGQRLASIAFSSHHDTKAQEFQHESPTSTSKSPD